MKLHILGSCSGTEPMPDRKHTSFVLETSMGLYWFDAGEGCSYTAHNMGLDLLSVRKIVISHPHMDHVGGLANLLWTIRKLRYVTGRPIEHQIEVWMPNKKTYDGIMQILGESEGHFKCDFEIVYRQITDGILFSDEEIAVSTQHNLHLGEPLDGNWQTFSFRVTTQDKIIVFSGDCKSPAELLPLLPSDLILMETGHHEPTQAAALFAENNYNGLLLFVHHGRQILLDPVKQLQLVKNEYSNVRIANDGDILESGVDF